MLGLILLVGCRAWTNFTPERTVLLELEQSANRKFSPIIKDSVKILQQTNWQGEVLFLTYYAELDKDGQKSDCLQFLQVNQDRSGWVIRRTGVHCDSTGAPAGVPVPNLRMVEQFENWDTSNQSTVLWGLMRDQKSVAIEFEWEDGKADRIDLVNASFLVLRTGNHRLEFFRGLDAEGQPVPAP